MRLSDNSKLLMYLLIVLAYVMLSGCATTTAAVPIEVKIPVPVKCSVETPIKPVIACYKKTDDIDNLMNCLDYKIKLRRVYEQELNAALESCK